VTAPDFTLPDTDGAPARLLDGAAPATIVVFTCNHCPYALAWHERIQDVARDYAAAGVRTLQINPNDAERYPRDSLAAMRERVERGEFAGPYLRDESQEVARAWAATVTPHVFVVDARGDVVYRGAPDADHGDESLRAGLLRSALDDVLAGRPVALASTPPVGCSIKWLR
jgi:peroxiredoxin